MDSLGVTIMIQDSQRDPNESTSTARPVEVVIASILIITYALWYSYNFFANGVIVNLLISFLLVLVGIGLFRKSRKAYIASIIIASIITIFTGILIFSFIVFPPRVYISDIYYFIPVLSLFTLFCLRTHRTKHFFRAEK